ncbi:MAG: hypothetical protein HMLKMBBP_03735 [Planctomycetes bacterium]|nr:hypothetical protein [Planctomycetota bacterium]
MSAATPSRPRVLVLSDVPGAPTGFGGQAPVLLDGARKAGAEPVALGMSIRPRDEAPVERTLPDGTRFWQIPYNPPAETLRKIVAAERPSALLTLAEFWMMDALDTLDLGARRRTFLWCALDCPYMPESRARWLAEFGGAVALVPYGARVLEPVRGFGGRVETIPHAVRRDLGTPSTPEETAARRRHHGLDGVFVALAVGRNQFRKGQPWLLDAWSRFHADLPAGERDSVRLFLHAEQTPPPFAPMKDANAAAAMASHRGCDLPSLIEKHFAAAAGTIEFSDLNAPERELKHLYGVCDVHVSATLGEGFGVPFIEAQACGRANIAPENTAVADIVGSGPPPAAPGGAPFGWLVPCSHRVLQSDVLEWRPIIDVPLFARALREAWELRRAGVLNSDEASARRRDHTLRTYGWEAVTSQWADLVRPLLR